MENPLVVDTTGHIQTDDERKEAEKATAKAEAEEQYHRHVDAWMLGWSAATAIATILLVVVGFGGIRAALNTLKSIDNQTQETARAAAAAEQSNLQSADFFRAEKRPWVGILGSLSMRDRKSTKPGYFGFTLEYVVKNFGVAPAFNTVVPFGDTVEGAEINNYGLVKSKVDKARQSGENIVNMTGDLLLPGAEQTKTCEFAEIQRAQKFVITGCIVYRFADGTTHHTELSYWIDMSEGDKAEFRTLWFQAAD